ncbi:MAG: carboxypeptidase regulatory-like domain-containing protein, partial [Candidatus Marinimicrobia bacterium]|nr:carboxypeptidase regulatory-like domain-containing protein [Candidatus Neomarinimicrobiota bacterium]
MKNQPMRSTVGVNRHVLHCAWGVVFTLLYLCLAQVAGAATYSQSFRNSGQGYNHHLTVEPGNHTFRMTGVPKGGVWPFNPSSRTEWYVNGSHKDTKNSYLGSSDPSYTYGQSSGTYSVSAIVYDGNWNWRESHHWNLTVRQYGSLTATIEPSGARSAGAQWRLTSGPDTGWKNSGYMLNNIPVANYTLEFRSVSGWDRPGNRTVGIIANACRMETATYTRQQGSLRVTIEPSGARSAGAQWRLTSGPDTGWKNSGAILTVPLSAYTLEYRNISGWDRPSSTSVSIQANQTISRTGTYTQPVANLGVTINPSGARSAGAQWRVTTGPDTGWKTSGTILTLPAGNYTVSYRTLAGWVTPANESVSLAAYTSNGRTGTYVEHGAFNGQINPSAVRANARWRLSGNGYDSSWQSHNTTLSVPPGSGYTLQFNDVTGWVRPGNQSVTVSSATSTGRTGTYEQPVGSLYVTLEPGAARSAGARWRLTGGPDTAWKTSGSSLNNLPVGTYTLECKSLTGWDHPANRSVTLIANATKIEEAVYVQHGTFTGQINPAEARASARWRLTRSGYDSNWQSHGVTLTVPPGSGYTLQFNEVTGWGRPANQTFSLAAATSHVRTGTYEQSQGSLRVTIEPSAARGAGAQWRLTSGPDTAWKTSGAMVTVPSGAYTLEYKSLSGWNRPASENLSIPANQTLSRTGSYAQAVGTLDVTLEPAGARSAGARWRLTSGPDTAWKTSGSQVTVPTGSYTLEFNAVSGWERPASQTVSILANQNVGRSGLYTTAPTGAALLRGTVSGRSSTGASLGTITGAQVTLSGIGARQTDSQGGYRFDNVPAGTYTLQVSATGYHAASRTVTLSAGQTRNEPVSLTATGMTGAPSGRNFRSPKGTHFLAGLPGNVNFEIEVDWQGAPGTVRYQVGGIWRPATLTALGGGLSRATVTAPLPEILFEPTPLRVEITNGAGRQTVLDNLGVHFYPVPLLMNLWFAFEIPWQGYSFSDSKELMVWDTKIPSGIYESKATVSYGRSLRFDPHAGSLFASLSGSGAVKAELKFDGVEQLGEGEATLAGTNITTFRGLEPARHDPALTLGVHGMAGVGAPAVRVISGIFPPAASVIEPLRKVPVVKDVLEALRLRAFLTGGLEMEALFDLDNPHDNWLGVTDLDAAGSIGLEGQAVLELWGAEAGAYIGGSAGPKFKLYPELAFEEMVLRGYVGAYASAWLFEYSAEIGTEVTFRPGGEAQMQQLGMPVGTRSLLALGPVTGEIPPVRHPVGHRSQRWGAANRLPAAPTAGRQLTLGVSPPQGLAAWTQMHGTPLGAAPAAGVESRVLENVLPIASPALGVGADGARILFTSYDAERPWYAATEIGELTLPTGMTHWNLEMLPGNQAAAFTPSLADAATAEEPVMMPHEAGGLPSAAPRAVAAWTRITGDASAAEGPEDIAPLLDIVVARRDAQSGAWGDPVQLTDNGAVSRQPRVYAVEQMGFELLLWIQNEGDATLGNSEQPDRLMASFWEGSEWMAPEVLATLDRGLVDYAFTVDALGAPRLVLVVDEDGDAESRDDRELYALDAETMDLIRLTQDALPDEKPMLVAPNGEALCVWLKDGALHYSALETWLPRPLFADEELAGVSPSLQGLTMPNGAVIAYTAQLESGVDIVASFYDAQLDRWSLPTRLTDDAHVESSLSLAWDDEADALVAAYLKTETVRADIELDFNGELHTVADVPQPGRTDLYVLHYTLGHDLALAPDSLRSLPANPAPGSLAELRAVVRNQGEMSADVTVEFYDGDPLQGGSLIEGVFLAAEELVPGGEVEVTIPWEVPADAVPQRVWAVVDPELDLDDRDRANNSATRTTVLPDLLVASAQAHEVSPTAVELVVTLENDGVLTPADHFLVEWRNEEDTVVASALAEPMAPGTSQDVAALWDCGPGSATDAFRTLQIQVLPQADDDDFTLENNTYAQTVALPQADPEAEWLHAVEPAAPLHGAAAATGQTLQVIAVADWTCTADADWLTVTAGAAGTGSGAVTYDLAANPGAEARTGTLVLAAGAAQHIVTVTQAGMAEAVLRYTAGAGGTLQGETTQRIALGGAGSPVEAMAQPGFVFERWSDGFAAALRTDTQVTGDLEVTAQFAALALDLVPAHRGHPAAGATGQAFAVEANTAWTAVADEAWLVITSGASGTGSDAVVYDVAVNVGPARTGSVTVAGEGLARTFTVTQAGAALTAPVFNPPAGTYAAGTRSVTVTAAVGADIRYTMGGGEPPCADPTEASAALAGEGIVEVPVPGWLKARAWQTGYEPSPVTVAVYVSATGAQYALTVEQGTGSGA